MGSRDFRRRETKKPKQAANKTITPDFTPEAQVEVIKKGKKPPQFPE